jgi:two-component system nitrogen regulation sensor histidine kinase NtrY
VGAITSEVNKLDSMLKEFRDFARLPLPQKRWFDLSEVLKKIVSMNGTAHPKIKFKLLGAEAPWEILGDEVQMDQVFTNLVKKRRRGHGLSRGDPHPYHRHPQRPHPLP